MILASPPLELRICLGPEERRAALRRDVLAGLSAEPKELPPKWLYDKRGSQLFTAITRLPEYYLTRRERALLAACSREVARATGADTLVELGSGTSEKTRFLLDALRDGGWLRRFAALDVSAETLRASAARIAAEYSGVAVTGVVGDLERHLDELPREGRRLVAFLGSSIGNFPPAERAAFLRALRATLDSGDALLLGVDLVKDPRRLLAAYDDAAGVTAAFNRNVLLVLNRELGADFQPERFDHVARWDAGNEWIELLLRSQREQTALVAALGLEVRFARGEELRTEISAKFRPAGVRAELAAAGLAVRRLWTDAAGDFGLLLAVPDRSGEEGLAARAPRAL